MPTHVVEDVDKPVEIIATVQEEVKVEVIIDRQAEAQLFGDVVTPMVEEVVE